MRLYVLIGGLLLAMPGAGQKPAAPVAAFVAGVTAAAAWSPARRLAFLDPASALRE